MSNRARRGQRGMTLVEVMVAGAVLAFVLVGAMLVLIGVNNSSERIRRVGDAQTTGRQALAILESELRAAGVGASQGSIAIGASGGVVRIPTIYSEPDRVVTTPGGGTVNTASIFIITADPPSVGITADGTGLMGSAFGFVASNILAQCSKADSTLVKCDATATPIISALAGGGLAPLIVTNDFRWAMMVTPTGLIADADPNRSQIQFSENGLIGSGLQPDPDQPFGLAHLLRARVTHWYLKFDARYQTYSLLRSYPKFVPSNVLAGTPCDPAAPPSPFVDEASLTQDTTIAGVEMGAPIDGLQLSYVTGDPTSRSDMPGTWTLRNRPLTVCDGATADYLREVRLSVVTRTRTPDPDAVAGKYTVPALEGAAAATTGGDAFPRRTFMGRVIPRNALGFNAHLSPGT